MSLCVDMVANKVSAVLLEVIDKKRLGFIRKGKVILFEREMATPKRYYLTQLKSINPAAFAWNYFTLRVC